MTPFVVTFLSCFTFACGMFGGVCATLVALVALAGRA